MSTFLLTFSSIMSTSLLTFSSIMSTSLLTFSSIMSTSLYTLSSIMSTSIITFTSTMTTSIFTFSPFYGDLPPYLLSVHDDVLEVRWHEDLDRLAIPVLRQLSWICRHAYCWCVALLRTTYSFLSNFFACPYHWYLKAMVIRRRSRIPVTGPCCILSSPCIYFLLHVTNENNLFQRICPEFIIYVDLLLILF